MQKHLLVILGPTASGKTKLAIDLATEYNTEILSADSRQFFKETTIGTAKPSPLQLGSTRHHFINCLSIHDAYNVGDYELDAIKTLDSIFTKKNIAILSGGSGLYSNAVCNGFDDIPSGDKNIRQALIQQYKQEGIISLQETLKKLDFNHYEKMDKSNPHRLIRAIEVCLITGKPFSTIRQMDTNTERINKRPFSITKIGLNLPREELYHRINIRVDKMMEDGLLEEVRKLLPFKNLNALNTVGYKEIFAHLEGECTLVEAIEKIKQNTRNFAKRQLTWWRKDKDITWFDPSDKESILQHINIKSIQH